MWTKEQQQAIDHRGSTLLVSAAAGSGKTAVLVERVIKKLVEDNIPITDFLIVTFTSSAASEMKGKILAALNKNLKDKPYLSKQIHLLNSANITTVHSFCLNLIREFSYLLDLPADFSVGDVEEVEFIKERVLESTLEEFYENPDFCDFANTINTGKDDRQLKNIALSFYSRMESQAFPEKYLDSIANDYKQGSLPSKWLEPVFKNISEMVEHHIKTIIYAINEISFFPEVFAKYSAFQNDLENLKNFQNILKENNYELAYEFAQNIEFKRLESIRGFEDKDFLDNIKKIRSDYKDDMEKMVIKGFLSQSLSEIADDMDYLSLKTQAFTSFMKSFYNNFTKEKLKRKIIDFSDIEHGAVKLLSHKDIDLSMRYHEIMVDEYQDTNPVQDYIFQTLSNGRNNLFMVGDVKQSIYRFRSAEPTIFLEKYLSFTHIDKAVENEPCKVILSKNFRSRNEILDSVNYICEKTMSKNLGDIDYNENEKLYLGAEYYPNYDNCQSELSIIETTAFDSDKLEAEAKYVATRIWNMIENKHMVYDKSIDAMRPCTASDFAILLRSVKDKSEIYAKALSKVGINSDYDKNSGLLNSYEIKFVSSFLKIIQNPDNDLALITVMKNIVINFSASEIAEIRLIDKNVSMYKALCQSDSEKSKNFLTLLEELRFFSTYNSVYNTVWEIYNKTSALGIFSSMTYGMRRYKNLIAFASEAEKFEAKSFKGLYSFNQIISSMYEKDEDFSLAAAVYMENSVKIMSSHKSKGLEFPIVFLCDMAKKFNKQDIRENLVSHNKLGAGYKILKNSGIYSSFSRKAIAKSIENENLSEELRVLYVAMTRAKEKLIICCSLNDTAKKLEKIAYSINSGTFDEYSLKRSQGTDTWILSALMYGTSLNRLCSELNVALVAREDDGFKINYIKDIEDIEVLENQEFAKVNVNINLPENNDTPSKIVATQLKQLLNPSDRIMLNTPSFARENKKLSASEKGTAHHIFMQFADFSKCTSEESIEKEISRLFEIGNLSKAQAEAIETDKIMGFFRSNIYKELCENNYKREFKFSVLVDAKELLGKGKGEIMLQGVIDCLYIKDDEVVIVDYKTDSGFSIHKKDEYREQMQVYKLAAAKIFNKKCTKAVLYFFGHGELLI